MATRKDEADETSASPTIRNIGEILSQLSHPWQQAELLKASRLLRISVLRELTRSIHTLRSECLATDRQDSVQDLSRRETFLNAYFHRLPIEIHSLEEIYRMTASTTASGPLAPIVMQLPPELLKKLDPAKLARADRRWEAAMADEASRQGWGFWQFDASTEIHDVERFARVFSESLWPRGLVLFVESDGFLKVADERPERPYWRGKWTVVLDSHLRSPEDLALDFSHWPHADPRWTKLS